MDIKKLLKDGLAHYVVRRVSTTPRSQQADEADERVWPANRKPKGWRQARKKRRKQAKASKRRNR